MYVVINTPCTCITVRALSGPVLMHLLYVSPCVVSVVTELIGKGDNGIILRDQDATNKREGEWVKVNTLGHFNLEEMVRGH